MITKEEVLIHRKDSEQKFIDKLISELELAIFDAASNQKSDVIHPFHPLLEPYIIGLGKNGFGTEKYGFDKFRISW